MFCNCLHAAESHHADGCHALHRDHGVLTRCPCPRTRAEVARGPDHLNDVLWHVRQRTRNPQDKR